MLGRVIVYVYVVLLAVNLLLERPVALGSDEGAWARNRRAVTVTVQ